MQSPACLAAHGGDTTGTFDAKCIEHRRVMRLKSPSMEGAADDEPQRVSIDPWKRLASDVGVSIEPKRYCGSQLSAEPLARCKRWRLLVAVITMWPR